MTQDDDGLSLIELVVYLVVLGFVTVGLTTIFVNMWATQANVDAQTRATTRGQLVTSAIEKAMRNATAFQVTDGGSTLLIQTSFAGSRRCQSFHVAPVSATYPTGALQMVSSAPAAPAPASGYPWQKGIQAHTDGAFTAFFTGVNTSGLIDSVDPKGVHYSFQATAPATTTKSGPVTFSGTAFPRNTTLGDISTCWP